jgi:hypothetical protein
MHEEFPIHKCTGNKLQDANNPHISDSLFLLHYGEDKKTIQKDEETNARFQDIRQRLETIESESDDDSHKMAA